jgi:hypothetical protein
LPSRSSCSSSACARKEKPLSVHSLTGPTESSGQPTLNMISRDSMQISLAGTARRASPWLTSADTTSTLNFPSTNGGRARFDQGSKRRDEYGRAKMGGDYVNEGIGVGTNARRIPLSHEKDKGKVSMQHLQDPLHLQLFLRLAQAELALDGDKYAQRVITKDEKSQLKFRTQADFIADDIGCMQTNPTVRFSQMTSLLNSIDLTNQALDEEIKALNLKADVDLAEDKRRIATNKIKDRDVGAQSQLPVRAPRRGAAGGVAAQEGAGDDESTEGRDIGPDDITDLIAVERDLKSKHLGATIDNAKSRRRCASPNFAANPTSAGTWTTPPTSSSGTARRRSTSTRSCSVSSTTTRCRR